MKRCVTILLFLLCSVVHDSIAMQRRIGDLQFPLRFSEEIEGLWSGNDRAINAFVIQNIVLCEKNSRYAKDIVDLWYELVLFRKKCEKKGKEELLEKHIIRTKKIIDMRTKELLKQNQEVGQAFRSYFEEKKAYLNGDSLFALSKQNTIAIELTKKRLKKEFPTEEFFCPCCPHTTDTFEALTKHFNSSENHDEFKF